MRRASAAAQVFPLAVSGDSRGFVTAGGVPFFLNGDTCWSLPVQYARAAASAYMVDRATRFNAYLMTLVEHKFSDDAPNTIAGLAPFGATSFVNMNDAYFDYCVGLVEEAYELGLLVLCTVAYLGHSGGDEGWWSDISARSTAQMQTYGEYVGAKFAHLPNFMPILGGDYYEASVLTRVRAVQAGLANTGHAGWLYGYHANPGDSSHDVVDAEAWLDVNCGYMQDTANVPQELAECYSNSPTRPAIFYESRYEQEGDPAISVTQLRSQAYWAWCAGMRGVIFGNSPIWHGDTTAYNFFSFTGTPSSNLNSTGSQDRARFGALLASRGNQGLTPDGGTVLTGGVGTGTSTALCGIGTDTAAIYTPTQKELTVDMDALPWASTHGWWYRPSTGATVDLGTLSGVDALTPPTTGDHVLVLDDAAAGHGAPG